MRMREAPPLFQPTVRASEHLVVVDLGLLEALKVHTRVRPHLVELRHFVTGPLQFLPGTYTRRRHSPAWNRKRDLRPAKTVAPAHNHASAHSLKHTRFRCHA